MTSIGALPAAVNLILSNVDSIKNRSPDSIASGFQTLLQNQVKASQRHALNIETLQLKQSENISSHRLDTDTLLAQLLASRKMLLPSRTAECHSATPHRRALAECRRDNHSDSEACEIHSSAHIHKTDSRACPARINDTDALNLACATPVAGIQVAAQPHFPAMAMLPLAYLFIWVSPEFVRLPVRFSNGHSLRIRRVRLLGRTGRRQTGHSLNEED
ncbi:MULTISPECIES: hypothetical protein [Pantoea]|uniref:hypothetical protein n=1 Tax=Pantoea TaxID=53335 RepID=UPI000ABBDA3E|nr:MULTISPECIES: hypothetical protein [Pantoea]MBS6435423.1 hypothetical protein [Pantoea sp.]MDU2727528.1 hypothetical protein [Pantoea sp.]